MLNPVKDRFVGVRMPADLLQRVDEHAARVGEKRSLAIRLLLRKALADEREGGAPAAGMSATPRGAR